MDSSKGPQLNINDMPVEIIEHIMNDMSLKECCLFGRTCKRLTAIVFNDISGVWRIALKRLEMSYVPTEKREKTYKRFISKVFHKKTPSPSNNLKSIFLATIRQGKEPGMDDFFKVSSNAQLLGQNLGMKPSQTALEDAIKQMQKAAEKDDLDIDTFEALLTHSLKHLNQKQLRNIYANALTTMPPSTIKKMLDIRPINIKDDSMLQSLISIRQPEFKDYLA